MELVLQIIALYQGENANILYFQVNDPILRLSDRSKILVRVIAKFWSNEIIKKRMYITFSRTI